MKKATKNFNSSLDKTKPGSEPARVNRPHDFGVSPDDTTEVKYASHAALSQDPGRRQARSGDEADGRREVGVGIDGGGVGAGSGGDIDPDIVGVGTHGSGVAQTIGDAHPTPVTPRPSTAPPNLPTQRKLQAHENTAQNLQDLGTSGADAIRTDAQDSFEDATAGEISSDEANGTDNDEGIASEDDPD